jgi:hypothetical protein
MSYLLLVKDDKIIRGERLSDLTIQAGVTLRERTLMINGRESAHYGASYNDEELAREAARDGVNLLCKNCGWSLYERVR